MAPTHRTEPDRPHPTATEPPLAAGPAPPGIAADGSSLARDREAPKPGVWRIPTDPPPV